MKKRKMKLMSCVIIVFLMPGALSAKEYGNESKDARVYLNNYNNGKDENIRASKEHPFDAKSPDPNWVQTDRFELEADPRLYQETLKRKNRFESALDGTLDISILQAPVYKLLKTIDTIYLHPSFTTTVLLPEKYAIVTAVASFNCIVFQYANNSNMLIVRPNYGFRNGNIVMTYTNGVHNGHISINVRQYLKNSNCKVAKSGNYKCADEYFSTNYQYYEQQPLKTEDKIRIVKALKQSDPDIDFRKEHLITYRGCVYYVQASDHGSFFYKNMRISFRTNRYQ